jgi:hypothetical protein
MMGFTVWSMLLPWVAAQYALGWYGPMALITDANDTLLTVCSLSLNFIFPNFEFLVLIYIFLFSYISFKFVLLYT